MTTQSDVRRVLAIIPAVMFFVFAGCDHEKGQRDRDTIILESGAVHEGWYFGAADQVSIDGTVNGDAYLAGGTIDVNGDIHGDLLVAGGNITINGTVSDDIRVAGGNITMNGSVGKNVTVAGGNISLGKQGKITGNLLSAGGNLSIDGAVGNEVKAAGGEMKVRGSIENDATFTGGNFDVFPGATIGGNVHVATEDSEDVSIAPGTVAGTVERSISAQDEECDARILGFSPWHFWLKVLWLGSLLLTGAVLTLLFPKQLNRLGAIIRQEPLWMLLWGGVGLFIIPVAVVVLCITLFGVPLAMLLSVLYVWVLYLSQIALGMFVGQRMLAAKEASGWRLLGVVVAGILVVQVLTFAPILRYVVILFTTMIGTGALLKLTHEEYLSHR